MTDDCGHCSFCHDEERTAVLRGGPPEGSQFSDFYIGPICIELAEASLLTDPPTKECPNA